MSPLNGYDLDAFVGVVQLVALLALGMGCIAVGENLRCHTDGKACSEESQHNLLYFRYSFAFEG
jgi:hypothetical protein